MNTQTQKISTDDALFVIQKTARDEVLEAAQKNIDLGFEYVGSREVEEIAEKAVNLFKPTLDELKNR